MARLVRMLSVLTVLGSAVAQEPSSDELFARGQVTVGGTVYPYRLLEPLAELRDVPRPLVVFLHGAGERGLDNELQLRWLPERLAVAAARQAMPCFVLAVQCPPDEKWTEVAWHERENSAMAQHPTRALAAVTQAIDTVLALPGIDTARIYATGLSMGGFGAIDLVCRQPDRFAGLLAVCGGGDPQAMAALVGVPVALWHGAADPVVPANRSRELAQALRTFGAPVVHRELAGVQHDAWRHAYGDDGGLAWLFAQDQRQQRRGAFAVPALVPFPDGVHLQHGWFALQPGSRCFAGAAEQSAAALFLDALTARSALRPGLTSRGEPTAGDVVFTIDPKLATPLVITIDSDLRVVARDLGALTRGAAFAAQALHTGPGFACPRARLAPAALPPGGRITFVLGEARWSYSEALAILREAWWFGADELVFAGEHALPQGLAAADLEKLVQEATRRGVRLWSSTMAPALAAGALEVDGDDPAAVLATPRSGAPVPFHLQLPPLPSAAVLLRLRWLLPALAERANQPDPLHLAGYWSRLGHQRR